MTRNHIIMQQWKNVNELGKNWGGGLNPPWLLPGIVDGPVSGRWHGLTVGWGR